MFIEIVIWSFSKQEGVFSTVDNKKTHPPCFSTFRFSCISPEPLELQKSYLHLFASFSKELSDVKIFFPIWSQHQLIFAKTLFYQKKVSCWKKSAIMKKTFWIFQNGGFFPITYFFLSKQHFCKYQLIWWPDFKNYFFIWKLFRKGCK